ncbi:MAG: hypothetical protein EHM34_09305 [Nitrosopumilales archaeon]|nr:MAG: hypothetical protein EHM34_09305 [Nitrosopumilales archaeon]
MGNEFDGGFRSITPMTGGGKMTKEQEDRLDNCIIKLDELSQGEPLNEASRKEIEEYHAYILSDEFKEEYKALCKQFFPNADPAHYFDDVMMFDAKGNPITYPEYIRLYVASIGK